MLLPDLVREIEQVFESNSTSTQLDNGLDFPQLQPRVYFGLCNAATIFQEVTRAESFSDLEKDLEDLLQLGDDKAKNWSHRMSGVSGLR